MLRCLASDLHVDMSSGALSHLIVARQPLNPEPLAIETCASRKAVREWRSEEARLPSLVSFIASGP